MHRVRFAVLVVAACSSIGCAGQSRSVGGTSEAAFEAFLRVAAFAGHSPGALAARWPLPLPRSGGSEMLLTAAHRLSVDVREDIRTPSQTVVGEVTLMEYVPDTVVLRHRITDVMQQLQAKYGAPDLCTMPLGPPGYLFTYQSVERVWTKGVANLQTRLEWWRTLDSRMGVTIIVASTPREDPKLLSCAARMP